MNCFAVYFGILFFLNPCVGTVDILPDFVGALLLLYGLKRISFVSDKIESTTAKLWGLFAVSVVKTVLMLFSGSFGGSTHVLLTFAFSVLEGMLLLYIFGAVTDGFESLKIRYGTVFSARDAALSESVPTVTETATKQKRKKKKVPSEVKFDISKFKVPVCAYTVFRLIMCFLPEATELSISKNSGGESATEALSEFKGLLYTLILPIVCLFMIFVVIRTVKTFKYYCADKQMLESFDKAYEDDKRDFPMRHRRKLLKTAYIMLMIGVVTSVFFYVDNKDLIPKMLTAAAFAVLVGYFGRNIKEKILGFSACAVLAVSSGLYYIFAAAYFAEFTEDNAIWLEGAAELYRPLCAVSIIESVVLFAVILFATVLIRHTVLEVYSSIDDLETKEKKIKKFKSQMLFFRIVAFLFCVAVALYTPLRPSFSFIINFVTVLDLALVLSAYFVDIKL